MRRTVGAHTCLQNRLVHPVLAMESGTQGANISLSFNTLLLGFCRAAATPNLFLRLGCRTASWSPLAALSILTPCPETLWGQGGNDLPRAIQELNPGVPHPPGLPQRSKQRQKALAKAVLSCQSFLKHLLSSYCVQALAGHKGQPGFWLCSALRKLPGYRDRHTGALRRTGQMCQGNLGEPRGPCHPPMGKEVVNVDRGVCFQSPETQPAKKRRTALLGAQSVCPMPQGIR